jgi:hypothetical protein
VREHVRPARKDGGSGGQSGRSRLRRLPIQGGSRLTHNLWPSR